MTPPTNRLASTHVVGFFGGCVRLPWRDRSPTASTLLDWSAAYSALEAIDVDAGGAGGVDHGWYTKADRRRFKQTATFEKHDFMPDNETYARLACKQTRSWAAKVGPAGRSGHLDRERAIFGPVLIDAPVSVGAESPC